MKISVKVKAGARKEKIENIDDSSFLICVRERPEKGMANKSVVKLVAKYFGVAPTTVEIVSGKFSKQKIIKF